MSKIKVGIQARLAMLVSGYPAFVRPPWFEVVASVPLKKSAGKKYKKSSIEPFPTYSAGSDMIVKNAANTSCPACLFALIQLSLGC